jgi:hypothetical protein
VLKNHVMAKVLRLCQLRDKPLVLAAVRFMRACVGLKDEFYNRYIAKNNCLQPLIEQLGQNAWLDNLLASAVIELLDFIRKVWAQRRRARSACALAFVRSCARSSPPSLPPLCSGSFFQMESRGPWRRPSALLCACTARAPCACSRSSELAHARSLPPSLSRALARSVLGPQENVRSLLAHLYESHRERLDAIRLPDIVGALWLRHEQNCEGGGGAHGGREPPPGGPRGGPGGGAGGGGSNGDSGLGGGGGNGNGSSLDVQGTGSALRAGAGVGATSEQLLARSLRGSIPAGFTAADAASAHARGPLRAPRRAPPGGARSFDDDDDDSAYFEVRTRAARPRTRTRARPCALSLLARARARWQRVCASSAQR